MYLLAGGSRAQLIANDAYLSIDSGMSGEMQ